jgi:nicotinic acid phosphoribosyltransferase
MVARVPTGLLTDRYEFTMLGAALRDSTAQRRCTFEVFARRLPNGRRYGVVAGTLRLLSAITDFRPTSDEVEQLRAEGQRCDDELLSLTTPLLRRHLNPFGRYYFDLVRMRQDGGQLVELPSESSASERVGP